MITLRSDGLFAKPCEVCGKDITHKYKSQLKQRTCSHSCQLKGNKLRLGKKPANAFAPGQTAGEMNVNWKGNKVSYGGIHDYIRNKYGSPQICEHCKAKNLGSRKHHWANISGEYKRDRNDWLRLCAKCHFNFDGRISNIIRYNQSRTKQK